MTENRSTHVVWTVIAAGVPVLIGIGWAALTLTPPDFRITRGAFVLSIMILFFAIALSVSQSDWSFWTRSVVAAVAGAILLVLLVETLRWVSRRETVSQASTQQEPSRPSGFRERVETVTIRTGSIATQRPVADLRKGFFIPFALPGVSPLKVHADGQTTYVDVTLYGGSDEPPFEIKRNEFVDRMPPGWDRNFNDSAFEVVNESQTPVFQLIYETPSRIQINGVLKHARGVVVLSKETTLLNPSDPLPPLSKVFRYPSWKYNGVLAEREQPTPPVISLSATFEHLGYAEIGSGPEVGDSIIVMAVTIKNMGTPTTVGTYSLDIIDVAGNRTRAARSPVQPAMVLRAPNGKEIRGEDAALDRATAIFPIPQDGAVTGLLSFTSKLHVDHVSKVGTQLILNYMDVTGKQHAAVHKVKTTVREPDTR